MLPASVALCALAILLLPAGAASHRAASPSALGELSVVSHRPAASTWRRTQCGSPSGDADIPTRWASEVSADTTPLPAYPRPQMVRGRGGDRDKGDPSLWSNLNGLWEWEPAADAAPPFGRPLNGSILVPFPVESCLSGVAPASSATLVAQMWYRLVFDAAVADGAKTLLHFGAVDWQATVYLNGLLLRHDGRLGNHTGGYDGFGFDVTDRLKHAGGETSHRLRTAHSKSPRPPRARRQRAAGARARPVRRRRTAKRQAARLRRRPARRRHLHPVVRDLADGLDGGGAPVVHFHAQDRPGVHHERQGHRLCRGRRRHHPGPVRGGRQGRDDGG